MAEAKRIVIVGGVAGGASAAARARRVSEDADILLLERGDFISFANCGMPYHIGGVIPERERLLVQTPAALRRRYGIDIRTGTEVLSIDRQARQVLIRDLKTGAERAERYDELILSPGAAPVRPPIPGIDHPLVFTLRGLTDMDAIKHAVDTKKPAQAVIVGGGYIGLEMAEALRARGVGVTLVELAAQVFTPIDGEMVAPIHQQLRQHGVDLRLKTSVTAIRPDGNGLSVLLSTGQSVACGMVILAVGVRPEVKLAREAGLEIGPTGGIVVDDHMRTNDPQIFAVGDAVEVTDFVGGFKAAVPLAGPANRQGRIAADNALGRDSVYRRTQGTAICKVFDLAVGITGLSEKACKRFGIPFEKVYVHPASHAGYYPGAMPLSLKLLFDPAGGKILGGQAVGARGVDKRIDVLAVAIRAGMTVFDLQDLELSYAPPYGSAKDPINYAGFVAANAVKGDVRLCHVEDVRQPRADQMLLDVRTPAEVEAGTIPGAVNVPVDDLRQRMGELPKDKEMLVFCQVGLRGYVACRMLSQRGLKCRNLTGGYKTYKAAQEMGDDLPQETKEMRDDTGQAPAAAAAAPAGGDKLRPVKHIDATAMQCPGPIMRLKAELAELKEGQALSISANDPAFPADVEGWCRSTGNELVEIGRHNGAVQATIRKGPGRADVRGAQPAAAISAAASAGDAMSRHKTIVVFSDDFDRAMAAFVIANGATAMGSEVIMFFTFWGINILRKDAPPAVSKNIVERMFGWMMPRGPRRLKLSKMNMAGMGTAIMKDIMQKKHVASLSELIASARQAGVKLVACTMSMDLMGIKPEELIDGVEFGGVAMYLSKAEQGNVNLFI